MKRILAAGVLGLVLSGSALAQQGGSGSDHTGPGGGGSGLGGNVGAFMPLPNGMASGSGINVGNRMAAATGNSPMAQASREVGGALTGTAGAVGNLTASLIAGGVPSGPSTSLSQALGTFSGAPTLANLVLAVQAYNDAVRAMPAGTRASPALRMVRLALLRLGSRTGAPAP